MADGVVIIPTYNEKENIEAMIRAVMGLPERIDILIVDDGSPDGTADIVRTMMTEFPGQVHMEERTGKLGLGTAYVHGFKWALNNGYEYIFEMDCDFSHNPNDLPRLYHAVRDDGFDVAIGSRYVTGVNVVNWPMSRVLLSYFASSYVRFITRMKIRDTTAGFKCYRAAALKHVLDKPVRFVGYAFQIEMKFKAWKLGYKITEVPIIFTDRQKGNSKMSGGIIREAIFGIMWMKITSWFTNWK